MGTGSIQLSIHLLGAPEVRVAGEPLILNDQKARALLYYLAATGRSHTRDHLATLLWSESSESDARHSLRSSLYHLRQALNVKGIDGALSGDSTLLSLKLERHACDVTHFRHLLAADSEQALIDATSLYRGPLLQGFTLTSASLFEEWLRFEESDLNQAYTRALRHLFACAERRQEWDEAIIYMQRLVQLDSLSEELQHHLISLYVRTGAIGQALHQYHRFETILRKELGLTPSPETHKLLSSALESRRSLTSQIWTKRSPPGEHLQVLPFVGRDDLSDRLLIISKDVRGGRGTAVLLQGESGIGKSRLLEEFSRNLLDQSSSWIHLHGSCSPFDNLQAYGPFLDAFQDADLSDLIDLLSGTARIATDEQGKFLRRVWQALNILAHCGPLLLTIDDLQWANSSTLELFGFLALRLHSMPVFLIGTVQQASEIPALHRLITLGRRRDAVHLFSLAPLTIEAVAALTRTPDIELTSSDPSTTVLNQWLYEHSDGNSFVLKELIAQLQTEGILTSTGKNWQFSVGRWLRWRATAPLPETVHDLVAWRLTDLSPQAHYLLDILAVANQPLPFALLREFPDIHENELVSIIENLAAKGIVKETTTNWFVLSHNLLRDSLIQRICLLRQQAIHRQLAAIIESCPALQKKFPLHQVARHAVLGGDNERAKRYGLQVLDELVQNNASAQTASFLHQLYDLLEPTGSLYEKLRLAHALGTVHQSLGQLEEATAWHRQYLNLAYSVADPCRQGEAHLELGELALVANNDQDAIVEATAGLAIATTTNHPERMVLIARGQRLLGAALAMDGSNLSAAESHLQEAVTAHRLTGNMDDLCAALFELGNVAAQRGKLNQALQLYEEAARTAEITRSHYFLALAYNNFAYHSLLLGQCDVAQRILTKGLTLAELHEMFGALLHFMGTQGEIHLYHGNWATAAEFFRQGLTLAEDLGNSERRAGSLAGLALALRGQQQPAEALSLLMEALALIAERGYWHLRTRIQLWQAETLLQSGRESEAELPLLAALATARAHGRMLLLIQGERLRARLFATHDNWQAAHDLFARVVEQASLLDLPLEIARTHVVWGETALQHAPIPHNGRELLARARETLATYSAHGELATTMTLQ